MAAPSTLWGPQERSARQSIDPPPRGHTNGPSVRWRGTVRHCQKGRGIDGRLAADEDVIQIGERDAESPEFDQYYGDIVKTRIKQITIQEVLRIGVHATCQKVIERLSARGLDAVWLHIDLDVLDQSVMPAVDSPGSPGLDFAGFAELIAGLVGSGRVVGADVAIYDPALDPGGLYAQPIAHCIAGGLGAIVTRP
jgi:arginase